MNRKNQLMAHGCLLMSISKFIMKPYSKLALLFFNARLKTYDILMNIENLKTDIEF